MRKNIFLLLVFFVASCIPSRIYKEFDEFENLRKFKLVQIYNAKKDFSGHKQIKISYYKNINQAGESKISARLLVYSNDEEGKLNKQINIRTGDDIYNVRFYDYQNNYDAYYEQDYDIEGEYNTINITHNAGENIRHIAYFDISKDIANKILTEDILSYRFFIGKEAYTIKLSKYELKQLQKFILIDF